MTRLYTTLTHTKLTLQEGEPPPMVAIPDAWKARLDLTAVLGMGGLVEDPAQGLRCPIKGCGIYRHTLARHLRVAHSVSAQDLKEALSLPLQVGLTSSSYHQRLSDAQPKQRAEASIQALIQARGVGGHKNKGRQLNISARNLRGACEAQLQERIRFLAETVGHSPTRAEAMQVIGHALLRQCERMFGSWNKAKASVGLPGTKGSRTKTVNPQQSEDSGGFRLPPRDMNLHVVARKSRVSSARSSRFKID